MYYDIKMKQAQVNQMNIQNRLLEEQTALATKKWWTEDRKAYHEGVKANLTSEQLHIVNMKSQALDDFMSETGSNFFRASGDAQLSRMQSEAAIGLSKKEIQLATQQTDIETAYEKLSQLRIQNAKTEQEKEKIKQEVEAVKKSNLLMDLQIQFVQSGGKWAPMILGLLGKLL